MPVVRDIVESYRRPAVVIRRKLADGPREDRAIATLMGACALMFVARWPARARDAHLGGEDLEKLLTNDLYGLLFIMPLLLYGLAALIHVVSRVFRAKGSWFGARISLFWALFASSPFLILNGLVEGLIGAGPQQTVAGLMWVVAFLWLWVSMVREAEWGESVQ